MMADEITPALLAKMAETPWSVVRYAVSLNYEGGPSWGAKHKKADMAEIEFGDECQAQAECDRLNSEHRAQYVQPLVDALEAMLSEEYEMATVIALDQRGIPPTSAIETVRRIENKGRQALAALTTEGGA